MKQVTAITLQELQEMAQKMYGNMVKADVDIRQGTLLVDMDLHADGEAYLLEHGSRQQDVWGINLHPDAFGTEAFIEFDSMINIRPSQKNPTRGVLDPAVRTKITVIVEKVVHG